MVITTALGLDAAWRARILVAAVLAANAACGYHATYDCITCSSNSCPSGYACQNGICRQLGGTSSCGATGTDAPTNDTSMGDAATDAAAPPPIMLNGTSQLSIANGSSMVTWSHVVGGANRLLVVGVSLENPSGIQVTSITYANTLFPSANKASVREPMRARDCTSGCPFEAVLSSSVERAMSS